MAENKKATIRRLTVLRNRLLIIGIVLAVTSGVCTVQVVRAEKQPEDVVVTPAAPLVPETTEVEETTEATEASKPAESTLKPEKPSADQQASQADAENDGDASSHKKAEDTPPSNDGQEDISDPDSDDQNGNSDTNDENTSQDGNSDTNSGNSDHGDNSNTSSGNSSQDDNSNANSGNSDHGDNSNANGNDTDQSNNEQNHEESPKTVSTVLYPTVPLDAPPPEPPLPPEFPEETATPTGWLIGAILSDVLLLADLICLAVVQKKLSGMKCAQASGTHTQCPEKPWHPEHPQIGKVHCIGARSYQQDSLGHTQVLGGTGTLAMVADGMGGLSGGDQVSQQIIMTGLNYAAAMTAVTEANPLVDMVRQINADINRMLGPDLIYKCGSTLIAVLAVKDRFHWISVGDSRIYLYRAGFVNQLNTDHDLMQLWMPEILSGDRSYAAATQDPEGRKVTSFIGMGDLKYMDYSRQAIRLRPGDRLILVTDGVYGAVPPETMAAIFKANQNVSDAAQALDQAVRVAALPHQDNYTALILGF